MSNHHPQPKTYKRDVPLLRIDAHKNLPAYWEAYCSVFLGETPPIAKTAQDEAAIAKGLEDGKTLLPRRKVVFLSTERRRRRQSV